MIRVVLVDDQALLRTGFRMILEAQPDIEVVGEAGDGAAAVTIVAERVPDVVLMDIRMPGTDGIAATERISASTPQSRVLILTTFDLDEYVYAGIRAGASGFLLKDAPPEHLLDAVRVVAGGEAVLAPSATRRLLDRFVPARPAGTDPVDSPARSGARERLGQLTDREREVFGLIAAGRSNREIARQLHVSEGTVKVHVSRLLAKLELRDRVQAVVLAYEAGVVTPGQSDQV